MSRSSAVTIILIAGGLFGLLALLPGSPIWRIFRPAQTVELGSNSQPGDPARSLEIVTLLPRDAIPAILEPRFVSGAEAEAQMAPGDRVIGVSIDGDHRAYSTAHLSSHEVVNDTVGGRAIAITW